MGTSRCVAATSDYLGIDRKTLMSQLRGGKSLADIANGLSAQGKSAPGLITTLTNAANARVDAAVTANKLTADQAAALKPKVATEITAFVNRSFTKPDAPFPRPLVPAKPSPLAQVIGTDSERIEAVSLVP